MVDVDDVVAQLLLQGTRKEAVGRGLLRSSDEAITLEQLMTFIAADLDVHARTVPVPPSALRMLGTAADLASTRAAGKKLPLNRKVARQLLAPGWTCSIEKAKALLGYRPKVTVAESLKRSCDFYLQQGWL